jgi:predicted nucleotidyltransferase
MGEEGIREVEGFFEKVRRRFGPEAMILFGSRSRGDYF